MRCQIYEPIDREVVWDAAFQPRKVKVERAQTIEVRHYGIYDQLVERATEVIIAKVLEFQVLQHHHGRQNLSQAHTY